MKIVIDITENAYEAYKEWTKSGVATVEQMVIARGTPYNKIIDEVTELLENVEGEGCEARPQGEWIPVKYRPMTTKERIEFAGHYGIEYSDTVDEKMFDCPLPDDGQEILISTKWGVCTDCADNDNWDGFTTYGLEGNGDWDGVDAWMPLPKPYKEGGEEDGC